MLSSPVSVGAAAGLCRGLRSRRPAATPPQRRWSRRCCCGSKRRFRFSRSARRSVLARWCARIARACHGRGSAKPELLGQCRTLLRIARCDERMIGRQFPAGAVGICIKPVPGRQMTAQLLAAKAAFKTHDIIALYRAPDRNRRRTRSLFRHRRRFAAEAGERLPDYRNQSRELVRCDLVMLDIAGDDARDELRIDPRYRAVFRHDLHPANEFLTYTFAQLFEEQLLFAQFFPDGDFQRFWSCDESNVIAYRSSGAADGWRLVLRRGFYFRVNRAASLASAISTEKSSGSNSSPSHSRRSARSGCSGSARTSRISP